MDDAKLQMVLDGISGMSVDDVEALINASVNVDEVSDSALLAGFLVGLAAA